MATPNSHFHTQLLLLLLQVILLVMLVSGNALCHAEQPCLSGNSYCANKTNVVGYICKCWEHYDGNPYIPNGCQDIDECKQPQVYRCSNGGIWKNKLGGYDCLCKFGMKDGGKGGTCTHVFTPTTKKTVGMVHGELSPVDTWSREQYTSGYRNRRLVGSSGTKVILSGIKQANSIPVSTLAGVVVAVFVAILLSILFITLYYWRSARDSLLSVENGIMQFDYGDLALATQRFSKESKIGEGHYGTVYRATIKGQQMAVKKLKAKGNTQELHHELQTVSNTKHTNLVSLKGCCGRIRLIDGKSCWKRQIKVELLLVFEWIPNGNLADHLYNREQVLPWDKRYKIVKGIGSALHYLHHECNPCILHRDIKPDNILLDDHFNAKLADFGLSMINGQNGATMFTTAVGSMGFMDPQYMKDGYFQFNRNSDVYSFGIVLLEIACTGKSRDNVLQMHGGGTAQKVQLDALADNRLSVFDRMEMERVVVLGLKCSHPDETQRPSMKDAMKFLEDGILLPAAIGEGGYSVLHSTRGEAALMPLLAV